MASPSVLGPRALAATGSTGNNTHAGTGADSAVLIAVNFVVEVAGATPTVTYKLQGSFDGTNWFDLFLIPSDSDTAAITRAVTAVGGYGSYLSQAQGRFAKYVRVVTTLNTNITYRAELYSLT